MDKRPLTFRDNLLLENELIRAAYQRLGRIGNSREFPLNSVEVEYLTTMLEAIMADPRSYEAEEHEIIYSILCKLKESS